MGPESPTMGRGGDTTGGSILKAFSDLLLPTVGMREPQFYYFFCRTLPLN